MRETLEEERGSGGGVDPRLDTSPGRTARVPTLIKSGTVPTQNTTLVWRASSLENSALLKKMTFVVLKKKVFFPPVGDYDLIKS